MATVRRIDLCSPSHDDVGKVRYGISLFFSVSSYLQQQQQHTLRYKWQFEDGTKGSGQWKDYIPSDQTTIERAYLAKQNSMVISNKWGKYDVTNLQTASPSQKSQKTGWVRGVRARVWVYGVVSVYGVA